MTHCLAKAAVALTVLLVVLVLGEASAAADPSLALSRSEAGAGEVVQFSIAGTEDEVTYAVELAGHEVAEGAGTSGTFTMPDLGGTARTVTVRVEVAESGETTTVSHELEYRPPGPAVAGTAAPAAAPSPAPAAQRATGPGPAPARSQPKKRPSRRHVRKRRGRSAPRALAPDTRRQARPHNRAAGTQRRRSHGTGYTTGSNATSHSRAPARHRSGAKGKPSGDGTTPTPAEADGIFGRELKPPLTVPLATLSPTAAANESGAASITAMVVIAMLGLMALTVAGAARRHITVGASDDDDEVLQSLTHVPASREPPTPL